MSGQTQEYGQLSPQNHAKRPHREFFVSISASFLSIYLSLSLVGCGSSSWIPPSETLILPTGTMTLLNDVYVAELSPDGRRFVFSRATKDKTASHIYVSNTDGTQARQLTNSQSSDSQPSWSPDGKRIIFVRAARFRPYSMGGMVWDNMDLWTVGADGSGEVRVTASNFYQAGSPHFSPHKHQVVFWAYRDAPSDAPAGEPGTSEIAVGDLDRDGRLAVLKWMSRTAGPDGSEYFAAENRDPSFSPDGSTIAFISNRVGNVSPYDYEVWLTDTAFSRTVELTHLHTILASPTFTPDGQYILATGGINSEGKTPLWRMKPDGSDIRQLR
jgi:Tol biopolymer transport system component